MADTKDGSSDRPREASQRRVSSAPPRRASEPLQGLPRTTRPPTTRTSSSWRLATVDFSLVAACRRIVEGALSVVPGERVLLVVDRERLELASALLDTIEQRAAHPTLLVLEDLGARPLSHAPAELLTRLRDAQASVFLASFQAAERQMRVELVAAVPSLPLRHAHMVGVSRKSLCAGFSADPQRIADAARVVRARLRPQSVLQVHSPQGTALTVRCHPAHRWIEHSGVIRPGKWENLPTGELFTAPGEIDGVFVCDASVSESFGEQSGQLRDTPVRLVIESGHVRSVSCGNSRLQRAIEDWLQAGRAFDRVGLVILGTNVGMCDPVGEILCDQNLPGLHLGLGATFPERTGASWDTQGQLTLAAGWSSVDLDGSPLIRSGRYLDLK